jgi:hypothetical protein
LDEEWNFLLFSFQGLDWRVTMPHRRTSGAKVRSHKIGIGKTRFQKGKQARLHDRRMLDRLNDPAE